MYDDLRFEKKTMASGTTLWVEVRRRLHLKIIKNYRY